MGLGTFAYEYKTDLKANAQPFAISTPRKIPLSLAQKVQKNSTHGKLGRNISCQGAYPLVFSHGGCAKTSGAVRICMGMKPLNENHPMPNFVYLVIGCQQWILANPTSSRSKVVDHIYHTIWTVLFQPLPFGISSAPEVF